MLFPICIHKDADSDYGVTVPDLPGIATAGESYTDALFMAKDAIVGHMELLAEEGSEIPAASTLEQLVEAEQETCAIWALVDIDITPFLGKAQKINVTLPGRLINKIDSAVSTQSQYGNRSNFLAKAAMKELGIN